MIVRIDYVDYDEAYGFFGAVIASSFVRGWSDAEIAAEREEMLRHLGADLYKPSGLVAREIEEIPAAA